MNKEEKYLYWLDAAEYDLLSAESMFETGRYTYVVFMCQQSLEKLIKGLYNFYIDDNIPRVHNVSFIFAKVADNINIEADDFKYELFDKLSSYYLQGRYPSFKEKVSQMVDKNEANKVLEQTKEVFLWLKALKK